ncbi:Fe-S-containing hydro-lyase [Psychrobacillus sp.]|uniref:Fe-S-containing hydro-lyase n=1 Tax=Psychrobacillus sp. TaxID=1871623 RepID=UPI0028BD40B8|nr:Fe-S-containing hydro-lyase [Psychrobacillus sp.]
MSFIKICSPFDEETISSLKAGDRVLITGVIYTARDAAHKRMYDAIQLGEDLPFNLKGQVIYYVGPTPAKPGQIIGSVGPTTSERMDKYTPALLEQGLKGMIGKGYRSKEVVNSIQKNKSLYLAAIGGAGALIARTVKTVELIAYEDLGTEAIRKITVVNFPAVVINDSYGNDWYEEGAKNFNSMEQ